MGSHRDSRQTTVEAVVQTRKPTEAETYFAKGNTTELVKMTSTATSERSGRIPDLKNHIRLKLHLKCSINRNSGVFLAGVEAPLLCSLLSSPSPHQLVVTPRRQQSQEVGVGGGWRSPE